MAQGDQPDDIKAEGDEQIEQTQTAHVDEDPEKGPAPLGYGGKPGSPGVGGEESVRSSGEGVQ